MDSPPANKATKGAKPDKDPSRNLRPEENSPYQAIKVRDNT